MTVDWLVSAVDCRVTAITAPSARLGLPPPLTGDTAAQSQWLAPTHWPPRLIDCGQRFLSPSSEFFPVLATSEFQDFVTRTLQYLSTVRHTERRRQNFRCDKFAANFEP